VDFLFLVRALGKQQLHGYEDQREAACEFEEGQGHQGAHHEGEQYAHQHSNACTQSHAPHAQMRRQVAAGQRDHNGIVTCKQNVDPDDLQNRDPEGGLVNIKPERVEDRAYRCEFEHVA
jgi:hypothetical protein